MGYAKDIGRKIMSEDGKHEGTVTGIVSRWCAGCGCVGPVYSVKWDDGKRSFPCPAGCRISDGVIRIS